MEHFTDIASKSNEMLMMSDEAMVEIISSDDLNVKNEEIVFECIIRWIQHDMDKRKQHIAKLLRCIRLGLLSTQYFVETVKVGVSITKHKHFITSVVLQVAKICQSGLNDNLLLHRAHGH